MLDKTIIARLKPVLTILAQRLVAQGVSPNQVTILGFVLGLLTLPALYFDCYSIAIILIMLNRLADGLDGAIARLQQPTDRGAFLDITLDFLFYSAIPLGFALANPAQNALAAAVLIYAFIGTGCSFLAFAIIAAKRGLTSTAYTEKGFYYLGGLTEATETIAVFILMCLFPSYFPVLAYSFAALCFMTTALRIKAGWEVFDS
ncbi:MAG: CDP-alcohol phosphatidyltransferase family protein [Thiofilum sp.]|uniref:CDP-alcohol phosphatidyltransferase family protein n=1 Tax=Thiofilum sp. TaxID=2212733 RepID=UPI0025F3C043|nr:CDP-alcohol phosphatidyltransferase family protein [Thiofilum sp.]MBK8454689.1 CDP-alcohol phosphatidyltransferase family protein [Thiofilum sp.]